MKFFLFGQELMCCSLAYRLSALEGEDVKVFSQDKDGREHLKGMVEHASSMQDGLNWVGRTGYVICDDEQDVTALRRAGYKVYGNNRICQRLEEDRVFQLKTCKQLGFAMSNFHEVQSLDEAISFIKKHPDAYAIKQVGQMAKTLSFVGKEEDGSDSVLQLEWMRQSEEFKKIKDKAAFVLQEVVIGTEVGVSAWWNRSDWLRMETGEVITTINFEHKKVGDGDTGLTCGESGTIARVQPAGQLFDDVLDNLTPWLLKNASDVCICIDANCGVTDDGIPYLFELCVREGYPASALEQFLIKKPAGHFFADLIDGRDGDIEFQDCWGEVLVMGSGQYPHETSSEDHTGSYKNQPVWCEFGESLMPLYVKQDAGEDFYRVADHYEMLVAALAKGDDIKKTNEKCVSLLKEVVTRDPIYRHDIGERVVSERLPALKKLGYL